MKDQSSATYRPEIDGLRAVAIFPVVLYHYGVSGFSGGFVGVDVFFVISGFLIGGVLWNELATTGRLRIGRFFARRIRRLAPAYLFMIIITLFLSWFILLPFDFREFGQEIIASIFYLSNVHFFREAGYFDQASEQKILLHTWSLSVEEQFYLVLPTLMLLLASVRGKLSIILVGLGLASFLACILMMSRSPPAAFYLFPFRAWELLAGVCLAIIGYQSGISWKFHHLLSWIGLTLILISVLLFEAGDHFPGLYALIPVLGATLIIANGRDANRLINSCPVEGFCS